MKSYLLSLAAAALSFVAAAQEPSSSASPVSPVYWADTVRDAMSRYEYSSAIALIDSVLCYEGAADMIDVRAMALMKARCQKKLYKFADACLTLEPVAFMEDIEAMGELADAYANDGRLTDALGTYYTLMMQRPGNLFFRLQILGLHNKMGSWEDCVAEGKEALRIDSLPQILSIVGYAYSKMGQVDSALVYYGKALEIKPSNVGYLTSVCNLLLSREDYGEAVARTGKYLVNVTPDEPEVEAIYGFASYQLKNYEESYKAFLKLREDGDRSYATFYYGGLSSAALEKVTEAVDNFSSAWQIDSTDAMLAAHYGDALRKCYRYGEAMRMFDRATELMLPNPSVEYKVAFGKGFSLFALEKYGDAIPYYKKAYELNPKSISVLPSIGYCYERRKDFANAKKYYEEYLRLGKPDTRSYEFVRQSLDYVNGELFME